MKADTATRGHGDAALIFLRCELKIIASALNGIEETTGWRRDEVRAAQSAMWKVLTILACLEGDAPNRRKRRHAEGNAPLTPKQGS